MRLAEGVGFEPTVPVKGTTVFETAPIDRSGTPPQLARAAAPHLRAVRGDRTARAALRRTGDANAIAPVLQPGRTGPPAGDAAGPDTAPR